MDNENTKTSFSSDLKTEGEWNVALNEEKEKLGIFVTQPSEWLAGCKISSSLTQNVASPNWAVL